MDLFSNEVVAFERACHDELKALYNAAEASRWGAEPGEEVCSLSYPEFVFEVWIEMA